MNTLPVAEVTLETGIMPIVDLEITALPVEVEELPVMEVQEGVAGLRVVA